MSFEGSRTVRKDFKLEIFLKSALPTEIYERIRLYEFCIVVSPKEDKVFKYVVVGDEAIYLTDYPPRTVKPEVFYRDVTRVDWVQDYPEFLDGDFRNNCQHVVVSYITEQNSSSGSTSTSIRLNTNRSTQQLPDIPESPRPQEEEDSQPSQVEKAPPASRFCSCLRRTPEDQELEQVVPDVPAEPEEVVSPRSQQTVSTGHISVTSSSSGQSGKLHLYIINGDAPAYLLIKSAWDNYMVRATLLLDDITLQQSTPRASKLQDETLALLFSQLKMDLLAADHSDDQDALFPLTNELRQATLRNFALKKFFWRSGEDLFVLLLRQSGKYFPGTQLDLRLERNRVLRNDELDYTLLMLDTLKIMFQETENMSARANHLRKFNGRQVRELFNVLFSEPKLHHEPIGCTMTRELSDNQKSHVASYKECIELVSQITDTAVAIIYEFILSAKTAAADTSGRSDGQLCELGLVRTLENHPDADKFVKRVTEAAIWRLSPSFESKDDEQSLLDEVDTLPPLQLVALFQGFLVLKCIIRNSKRFKDLVLNDYTEEFKYFVQNRWVIRRINRNFPLSSRTLKLISEVKKLVTGEHCELSGTQ